MLAKPDNILLHAMQAEYAVGAFNVSTMEIAQAVVRAAVAKQSPVIIQTSEGAIEYAGLSMISGIMRILAEEAAVPVIMHLDHGKKFETVKRCIASGYTSVMIDNSKLPFAENIAKTAEVVAYAHEHGVWVEAELGAIVGKEGIKDLHGGATPDAFLTNPEQAAEFVERTKIDSLAVSVGTIHGEFSGQEYIRFALLAEVQKAIPRTPLVLHGASGIGNEDLRKACAYHVSKVNVDTELRVAFEKAVGEYFTIAHDSYDPRSIVGPARDAMQKVVEDKIDTLGSSGTSAIY
ncbi:MAG TPA: class II fructose-bisphosphate aldolase [Candidatus Andersenbacteria bacterium]|nr:class II fructose-bisphosphate aldolase [Candidatus Andersenbacteria bacterium]